MSVWHTLGIAQTDSKAKVKAAYAEKLKHCRPEDDPQGFQILYAAYKQALREIREAQMAAAEAEQAQASDDSTPQPDSPQPPHSASSASHQPEPQLAEPQLSETQLSETQFSETGPSEEATEKLSDPSNTVAASTQPDVLEDSSQSEPASSEDAASDPHADVNQESAPEQETEQLSPEQQAWIEELQQEYQRMVEEVEEVIDNTKTRNKPEHWQFITESSFILDTQFNSQLGMFILDRVLKINEHYGQLSKRERRNIGINGKMNRNIMVYLNTVFHWHGQINAMRYFFGDDNTIKVLDLIGDQDFNARQHTAIDSVKGGKIKTKEKKEVNHTEIYREAEQALKSLKRFVICTHSLAILGFIFLSVPALMEQEKFTDAGIMMVISLMLAFQLVGVLMRYKFFVMSLWPVVILTLFIFPIGTIVGFMMIDLLVKGMRFFRY